MRTQSIDTHPDTEKVLISLLRKASISKKLSQVLSLSQLTIELSKRAIARANEDLNKEQINLHFIAHHYGKDLAVRVKEYLSRRYHENS